MNERIKELSKQAWESISVQDALDDEAFNQFDQKFAELIVRECSTHLRNCANAYDGSDTDADYMEAMLHSADMIKKHFGVE